MWIIYCCQALQIRLTPLYGYWLPVTPSASLLGPFQCHPAAKPRLSVGRKGILLVVIVPRSTTAPDTNQAMITASYGNLGPSKTEAQSDAFILTAKSCVVTRFLFFLAQGTKQKQFLGQEYPRLMTMNLIKDPELVDNSRTRAEEQKLKAVRWHFWFLLYEPQRLSMVIILPQRKQPSSLDAHLIVTDGPARQAQGYRKTGRNSSLQNV